MLSGTNFEYTRSHNQRVVLEAVRQHEPISRAEIARKTELNIQTISNIVDELLALGVVETGDRHMSGARGQPPKLIKLNPDGAFAIGLHLDRDHLTAVLVNLQGQTIKRLHHEIPYPTPTQAIPLMLEIVAKLEQHVKLERKPLWGIGVATPGPIEDASRKLVSPPDFPGWHGISLVEELGRPTGHPVFVEKDANAAAIGERWYGAGRAYHDFFYVYLGIGIGGGLILEGHPYRGSGGHAAELGSVVKMLANLLNGRELLETPTDNAINLSQLHHHLHLEGITLQGPHHLEALYTAKHPKVIEWLEETARLLVPVLLVIEDLFDPQAVIFGGRITEAMLDHLLERIQERLPERWIRGVPRACRLEHSQIVRDAACLGAASLPFFEAIVPHRDQLLKSSVGTP